jgi:excinuclease UvrABC nuclease subunit
VRTPGSWRSRSPVKGSFNSLRDTTQDGAKMDIVLAWTIVIYLAAFLLLGWFAMFARKLIKQHKPRFNSAMKRFRFHPFLKIDIQNEYPKIEKVYEIENDGANYYGPFSSGMTVNRLLKDINEKFFIRKCDAKKLKPSPQHPTCMYLEMGKCNAPCNFTETKVEYAEQVNRVHEFLISDNGVSAQKLYEDRMNEHSSNMEFERAAFLRDRLNDIRRVMSYQKVITPAINGKKIIIKCMTGNTMEIFFIQNGKLVKTYSIDRASDADQRNILEELTDTTEYLYFSLSKFIRHKFAPQELDEIKVISNWLALNRDRNSVFEIGEHHSREDVMEFLSGESKYQVA